MDQHHSSRVGQDRRTVPREVRHPNSVTAPPVNRGSMVPQPWRGFWNSIFTAILVCCSGKVRHGRSASAGRTAADCAG